MKRKFEDSPHDFATQPEPKPGECKACGKDIDPDYLYCDLHFDMHAEDEDCECE